VEELARPTGPPRISASVLARPADVAIGREQASPVPASFSFLPGTTAWPLASSTASPPLAEAPATKPASSPASDHLLAPCPVASRTKDHAVAVVRATVEPGRIPPTRVQDVTARPDSSDPPTAFAGPPDPSVLRASLKPRPLTSQARPAAVSTAKPSVPDAVKPASSPAERADQVPFVVGEPKLCRRIHGFGTFEPVEGKELKAGLPVLVYCELTGLRYQPRETTYVSRLSSRVELYARDGSRVWEQALGETEDECRSRRTDNYLGCRLVLPGSLSPGDYRLKLIQTDLVGRQSASAELPMTIIR
jgi:hypothetical protein